MENYLIDPEIHGHIKEIASRMKDNRASVMIGAGFSKNAEIVSPTDKYFLDWNSLGNIFFEKIHGRKPQLGENYLNAMKLAQEVEVAYGRTVLNNIIRDSLPDMEYAPSELHEKLLRLNWRDIFTTNYDTLLERAQERITDRHYNVILNKEDLVYSVEPRIIKLHGSFPSTLPFVITEEDYREYPKKSAVFVNTVQQALIENVLCLIGFSGDDPNFLHWIGWIRDNIGKDIASKIYLVGVFNYTEAEQKLLESRNIIVLNMGKCTDIKGNFKAGLELFFDELKRLTEAADVSLWPLEPLFHIGYDRKKIESKLPEIIREWKKSRKDYPGWYILPSKNRKNLEVKTYMAEGVLDCFDHLNLDSKTSLEFLFEYNWRINKCLIPAKILKKNFTNFDDTYFRRT